MQSPPRVTVIIPVFNQSDALRRCLAALSAQTVPRDQLQIVVVDNGSHEEMSSILLEALPLELVREPRPGSYAARNAGARLARGEILAFTDADCVPDPRWVEEGIGALAAPGVDVVAGEVAMDYAKSRRPSVVERYDTLTGITQREFVQFEGFGATANLWVPRRIWEAVGEFDARLFSGGDLEWGVRLREAGFHLAFSPTVRVRHPARRTLGQLIRRTRRTFAGRRDLARRSAGVRFRSTGRWSQGLRAVGSLLARGHWADALGVLGIGVLLRGVEGLESLRLWAQFAPERS